MKEAQVLIHLYPLIFYHDSFHPDESNLASLIWEDSINPLMIVYSDKHVTWIPTCFFILN